MNGMHRIRIQRKGRSVRRTPDETDSSDRTRFSVNLLAFEKSKLEQITLLCAREGHVSDFKNRVPRGRIRNGKR